MFTHRNGKPSNLGEIPWKTSVMTDSQRMEKGDYEDKMGQSISHNEGVHHTDIEAPKNEL